MARNSKKAISDIFRRISSTLDKAVSRKSLKPIAEFTIQLIVKRTRLGYGVDRQFGTKKKLKPLARSYIEYRRTFNSLSNYTTPARSNLTLTGQMLGSMRILSIRDRLVTIGPSGSRNDTSKSNQEIADENAARGRVFNRVSQLEYQQILREYRREFGDLLKKENLLR